MSLRSKPGKVQEIIALQSLKEQASLIKVVAKEEMQIVLVRRTIKLPKVENLVILHAITPK